MKKSTLTKNAPLQSDLIIKRYHLIIFICVWTNPLDPKSEKLVESGIKMKLIKLWLI